MYASTRRCTGRHAVVTLFGPWLAESGAGVPSWHVPHCKRLLIRFRALGGENLL